MLATKLARLAALSIVAFAGFTAAASAAQVAYTKSSANLREGPGTSYDIITTLPKNSELLVEACTATWCAVTTDDDDEGFIAKSLLKKNKSGSDLPFSIQIIIGPEGPFVEFGDIFGPGPGPKPSDDPEVCFYQQANFKGANFCVEAGDSDKDIPGSFDNNIESIRVSGGLKVEVCSGFNYGGECFYFNKNQSSLPGAIRNKITSYQVSGGDEDFSDYEDDNGNIIILQ
ncbi:MAG: hypothetical protein EOP22_16440 [Hyphomicrobiales bacterium]|nr:MAG: hypothetical protein EOP22_16440 [Hyphomicrobiales bacterium]